MRTKYNFITEGFDFDSLDDNDSIIDNNSDIDDLVESRRSVLNVASKILNTNAMASFKSAYIPELKTPVLYKSTKNPFMLRKYKDVLCRIEYDWKYAIKADDEWDIVHKVLSENIKVANRAFAKYAFPLIAAHGGKYGYKVIHEAQIIVDIANIIGYEFFNNIVSYLKQNGSRHFGFIKLYVSPDGGMFALSITHIPYNGFNSELVEDGIEFLMLGFTNNIKYVEAYQEEPKAKRSKKQ